MRKVWGAVVALIALGLVSFVGARRAGWLEFVPAGVGSSTQPSNAVTHERDAPVAQRGIAVAPAAPVASLTDCDPAQWKRAFAAITSERARQMMVDPDARAALIAAFLFQSASPDEFAWLEARREGAAAMTTALRLGADDPLVQWIAASGGCAGIGEACDPEPAVARLQRLEPDNTAVWLISLDRAVQRGDDLAAQEALLLRAARADHYNSHFGEFGSVVYAALDELPPPVVAACAQKAYASMLAVPSTHDGLIGASAMNIAAGHAIPSITPLVELCRQPPPSWRQACVDVFARMASSSEMIDQVMGLHLGTPLVADTSEAVVWRERLRRLSWLRQHFPGQRGQPMPPDWFARVFELGEMPAVEAWLVERGQRATPPPGWLPDNPLQRALIQTGRRPPESTPAPTPAPR